MKGIFRILRHIYFFTVTCRMTDWCLRQSSNDDFDWSIGTNCTETEKTGPCNDADLNNEGELIVRTAQSPPTVFMCVMFILAKMKTPVQTTFFVIIYAQYPFKTFITSR